MKQVQKNISFEAVYNFRDMGGYQTRDGRVIREGLFYRSAALGKMTSTDKELFEIPAKGKHAFEMPTNTGGREFYKVVNADMFKDFYAQMPFHNPSFKELMLTIQNPDNLGLVHHCAVGKDRTGIGGALILLALDVPEETIMEDYLDTNIHLRPMVERMAQTIEHQYNEQELQQFYALMSAREDYLQAALDAMDHRYGSKTAFLEQEFGLTADKREQLQSFCLI